MERRIGEQFDYNGVTLEVVEKENLDCEACFFFEESLEFCDKIMCIKKERLDNTDVYYKEVKK